MIERSALIDSKTGRSDSPDFRLWQENRWYAIYTRSRHEGCATRELVKKGIETFLPVRRVSHRWSDRTKTVEEPLFKGYVFIHAPLEHRWKILNTFGVVRFVGPSPAQPSPIPEAELQALQKFVSERIPMDPFPYLKEGMRAYVRSGPLKGVEGFIIRKDRHCRLVLSLDLLMQSVSVEIDQASVEPA